MQINVSLNNYSFDGVKAVHVYVVNGFNVPDELPQEFVDIDMETKTCRLDLVNGSNYTLIPVSVYSDGHDTVSVRDKVLRIRTYAAGQKNGYHVIMQGRDNIGVIGVSPYSIQTAIEAVGNQYRAYTTTGGLLPISFVYNNEVYHSYVTDAAISSMMLPITGFKTNSDMGYQYVIDDLTLEHVFDSETIVPALIALYGFLTDESLPKNMIDYLVYSSDTYYSVNNNNQFQIYSIRNNGALTSTLSSVNGVSFLFKEIN